MKTELAARVILDARKISDLLWSLDGADDQYSLSDLKAALDGCEKVYSILNYTRNIWLAADYSYKAREIAKHSWRLLDRIVNSSGTANAGRLRGKTHSRYHAIRESLRVLEWQFHEDECERLGLGRDAVLTAF